MTVLLAILAVGTLQNEPNFASGTGQKAPVIIPQNTRLKLTLLRTLTDQHSHVGDNVLYGVAEDVKDDKGLVLIPAGTAVVGKVTAKRGWNLTHWIAMIGFSADTLAISDGTTATVIPVHIKETNKEHHDFRTMKSLAPPKAQPAELAIYKATKQPIVDRLMTAIDSSRSRPQVLLSPFTADGAVVFGKVADLGQAQQIIPQLSNNQAVSMMKNIRSARDVTAFVHTLGAASAVTLVGFGIGLWELFDLARGLFRHVSVASGTLFDATTTQDTQILVTVPPNRDRGPWMIHIRPLVPTRFAKARNVEIPVPDPWLVKHRRRHTRSHN